MKRERCRLRCDECGRVIPFSDLDSGAASRKLSMPDAIGSAETHETLCAVHRDAPPQKPEGDAR